ncbi:hypothetical protein V2G26_002958 [Clonostachys chloroleuca]
MNCSTALCSPPGPPTEHTTAREIARALDCSARDPKHPRSNIYDLMQLIKMKLTQWNIRLADATITIPFVLSMGKVTPLRPATKPAKPPTSQSIGKSKLQNLRRRFAPSPAIRVCRAYRLPSLPALTVCDQLRRFITQKPIQIATQRLATNLLAISPA